MNRKVFISRPDPTRSVPRTDGYDLAANDTHAVQFYADDGFLMDSWSRHVGTVLAAGDAAIVLATGAHRQGVAQRLKARGMNLEIAAEQGRYVTLDAGETLSKFMRDDWPDARRFGKLMGDLLERTKAAAESEPPHVTVFGEMVALLVNRGKSEAAIRLEQLWNDLARTHSFSLCCAYPLDAFNREEHGRALQKICAGHSHVIPAESYTALTNEEERLHNITHLQQKEQALETARTERKKIQNSLRMREAELADFLENAVEGVQQVGADQRIRWANKSMLSLLGYREEEYAGHRLVDFHADPQAFDEFWHRLMLRENIYDFPAELRCKDGSTKHVLIHSNGLWQNGKFVRTRCFIRDVTDEKRMEQALRRSEKLAITGRLAASIAHEINNPLEALSNLFYLLQNHGSLDDTARQYASLADRELRRVAHITRQMLAFHRESSHPVPLKLSEILDSVVELYEAKLNSNSISTEKHYLTDGAIQGFPMEIRQLFANLLGNAIDACGDNGKILLHIVPSRDWAYPERRGVRISVADNGSGISRERQHQIFEPFFTTKGESGTGLGLWVSRGIVQKHQGIIRFRSSVRPGRSGTIVSVFLPATGLPAARAPARDEVAA